MTNSITYEHNDILNNEENSDNYVSDYNLNTIKSEISNSISFDFSALNIGKIFFDKKLYNKDQIKYITEKNKIKKVEIPKSDSGLFLISSSKTFKEIIGFNKGDILVSKDQSYIFSDGEDIYYFNKHGQLIGTDKSELD